MLRLLIGLHFQWFLPILPHCHWNTALITSVPLLQRPLLTNFRLYFPAWHTRLLIWSQHTFKALYTSSLMLTPKCPLSFAIIIPLFVLLLLPPYPFLPSSAGQKLMHPPKHRCLLIFGAFLNSFFSSSHDSPQQNQNNPSVFLPWHSVSYSTFCVLLVVNMFTCLTLPLVCNGWLIFIFLMGTFVLYVLWKCLLSCSKYPRMKKNTQECQRIVRFTRKV